LTEEVSAIVARAIEVSDRPVRARLPRRRGLRSHQGAARTRVACDPRMKVFDLLDPNASCVN
jgi:hypothetical protein